jgi:nicotinamidase-related amidase
MNFRSLLSGTALAGFLFATGLIGSAHAQAVTDDWASAKIPEAPEVKPVTIDPKTTALIVMDFNKAGCSLERRPRCVPALPNVEALLKQAREHHLYIVHTMTAATNLGDIPDNVKPTGDEPAFKAGADKFIGTDLEKMLKDHGITTIIAVGTAANGAELQTVGDAALRGFKGIVPVDGMPGDSAFIEAYTVWHLTHAPGAVGNVTLTKTNMVKF